MHSSRMRTGRSLTVCRGGGLIMGGCASFLGGLPAGGAPLGGEGLLARGVSLPGGVSLLGGLLQEGGTEGAFFQGGLLAGGGASFWRWGASFLGGTPSGDPPVNRITHTIKNITLATTSLRPVIKYYMI